MSRIGLVSVGDADDVRVWSGIPYHVKSTLIDMGIDVVDLSPLAVPRALPRHLAFRAARGVGRSYRYELDTACIREFGRQLRRGLHTERVDVLISLGVLPVANGTGGVPAATWSDATIENLEATYREYQRLPRWQRRNAARAEHGAAKRAEVLTYASEWAAESAIGSFGADPNRTLIAPFGANLVPPRAWSLDDALAQRRNQRCKLVWIGTDWERKRADFCLAVAEEMEVRGHDVELTLVGAPAPAGTRLPPSVHHLGFVDTGVPDGRNRLTTLLGEAHLLLLPSRAECFGIAVAEANAHAVPCLGSRVGGLTGAIRDGANGFLFAPDAAPADYADTLAQLMGSPELYQDVARSSRREYEDRLNWQTSCARILDRLNEPDRAGTTRKRSSP